MADDKVTTILEVLYLGNKAAAYALELYEAVNRGEMTEAEALAEWKANASEVKFEGARFDRLTS
jgi:hypothetical protein